MKAIMNLFLANALVLSASGLELEKVTNPILFQCKGELNQCSEDCNDETDDHLHGKCIDDCRADAIQCHEYYKIIFECRDALFLCEDQECGGDAASKCFSNCILDEETCLNEGMIQ